MSKFTGKQGKGALRSLREQRRVEADTRNALTSPERRSTKVAIQALTEVSGEATDE